MSKEKKTNTKQTAQLLSSLEKAKRELANIEKEINEERHQVISRHFQEAQNASRKGAQKLSRARAKIGFDNAVGIVEVTLSDARYYTQVADLYAMSDDLAQTMGFFIVGAHSSPDTMVDLDEHLPPPNKPVITSCPDPLILGEEYTLLGTRFGETPGEIRIEAQTHQLSVFNPTITDWSNYAVRFIMPTDITIPFSVPGTLTLKRLAPYEPASGTASWIEDQPETSITVNLVTESIQLYFSTDEYSDSGKSPNPFHDYVKIKVFQSPLLPEVYQLFDHSQFDADGLLIKHSDNTYVPVVESGGNVELLEGPYESQNSLHAKLRITDDWYWDYTVSAEFYILVPEGYSVPIGWQ